MFAPPSCPPGGSQLSFGLPAGPFEGYLFSDGTVKHGIAGGGFAVFDAQGVEQRAKVVHLAVRTSDSNLAELHALLEGLEACLAAGVRRLWAGTDSFQLIEHAARRSSRYAEHWARLFELAGQFERLTVQAIDRRRNRRADALARKSLEALR